MEGKFRPGFQPHSSSRETGPFWYTIPNESRDRRSGKRGRIDGRTPSAVDQNPYCTQNRRFRQICGIVRPLVLRADDAVELGRSLFPVRFILVQPKMVFSGLTAFEKMWLKEIGSDRGRLLLLAVGGGREAISLAKAGFRVGVDFIPEMVAGAQANAEKAGVHMDGLVQGIDWTRIFHQIIRCRRGLPLKCIRSSHIRPSYRNAKTDPPGLATRFTPHLSILFRRKIGLFPQRQDQKANFVIFTGIFDYEPG